MLLKWQQRVGMYDEESDYLELVDSTWLRYGAGWSWPNPQYRSVVQAVMGGWGDWLC